MNHRIVATASLNRSASDLGDHGDRMSPVANVAALANGPVMATGAVLANDLALANGVVTTACTTDTAVRRFCDESAGTDKAQWAPARG